MIIIEALTDNPRLNQEQLSETIGTSAKDIKWNLRKLKEDGIFAVSGLTRAGVGKCFCRDALT